MCAYICVCVCVCARARVCLNHQGTITEVDLNDVNHAPQFIEASDLAQEEVRYRAFLAADPCHGKVRHGIAIRRGSLQHGARECLQLDVWCAHGCVGLVVFETRWKLFQHTNSFK